MGRFGGPLASNTTATNFQLPCNFSTSLQNGRCSRVGGGPPVGPRYPPGGISSHRPHRPMSHTGVTGAAHLHYFPGARGCSLRRTSTRLWGRVGIRSTERHRGPLPAPCTREQVTPYHLLPASSLPPAPPGRLIFSPSILSVLGNQTGESPDGRRATCRFVGFPLKTKRVKVPPDFRNGRRATDRC